MIPAESLAAHGADRCSSPCPPSAAPEALAEMVDHEAMAYRARGTPEGDFLARQMGRLAQLIRWTGAETPEDYEDRIDVEEATLREHWYELGKEHQRRQDADDESERRTFGPLGAPLGDAPRRSASTGQPIPDDGPS